MITITKAKIDDYKTIADLGLQTFLESHGNSASVSDLEVYTKLKYSYDIVKNELEDPNNIFHLLHYQDRVVGYSKIIFNSTYHHITSQEITKLERLYILKDYHDLKLGAKLFDFNVKLSKENNQKGMWLFVWEKNQRAINFYIKNKFEVVGIYDFQISENHSNPNYQMLLKY
jgi:ribosomal protein S18 acetylase RimI-like enzyme